MLPLFFKGWAKFVPDNQKQNNCTMSIYGKTLLSAISLLFLEQSLLAQETKLSTDSAHTKYLPELTIVGRNSKSDIQQMPEIVGTSIYAGKKNALVVMDNVNGNVVTNTMRQVLAKVPGIQVWESDGSGIQIGIAARGLSPNRSWEFNVRQNGYDISADPYGYPEAYYNPQLQAVQRIEIVRGQGSLQYGPQFGGMVNYILRNGSDISKPFQFETQQTIGSNGLFNSYNAVGGKNGKSNYYAFLDHRNADGWRQNSEYFTNSGFGTYTYQLTKKWSVTAELMHSHIRSQQPGGLTDAQFTADAKQSFRSRNWFDIHWTTAALISNYAFNDHSRLNVRIFGILGNRNSVGYTKAITIRDSINPVTMDYNPRVLDIDHYRNYGMEARYLTDYSIGKINSTISGGIRLYTGTTQRWRDGVASTGTRYTGSLASGIWPRDISYTSFNGAAFAENIFRFQRLLLIPGIRFEYVNGKAGGINGYDSYNQPIYLQNQQRNRSFLLAGFGAEYHISGKTEAYANITQAYRPIQFGDLTAPPTTDVIDPNISDAKGYNLDLGYRGKISSWLYFDVSGYFLQYNNRVGTITQQRTDGSFYNYRTNVGSSRSKGIEALAEFSFIKAFDKKERYNDLILFASYSYTDARYGNLKVITKSGNTLVETNLVNKKVENAPNHILRTGLTFSRKGFSLTTQVSYTGNTFSDANNTVLPSSNGQIGLIPSYTITDITATYKWGSKYNVKAGINNLTDERYFTRRSGGYPGPGLLPADGRTFFVSVGATF